MLKGEKVSVVRCMMPKKLDRLKRERCEVGWMDGWPDRSCELLSLLNSHPASSNPHNCGDWLGSVGWRIWIRMNVSSFENDAKRWRMTRRIDNRIDRFDA